MNTKLLMTASAIVMGVTGITLSFLPQELLGYFNKTTPAQTDVLTVQILGALYFAFAMLNWTAKANLIGGIYARPIAIGNLTHFTIGSLALLKGYVSSHNNHILIPTIAYVVFAICFTIVFFRHPLKEKEA